jgi:electron transport complex protein RnfA
LFLVSELIALLCVNLIFTQALGTSTLLVAVRNKTNFVAIAVSITVFTTLGTMAAYFIDRIIPLESDYWLLICYIAVIAFIYILSLIVLNLISTEIFEKCKIYIHLSAFNCAVLGSVFTVHNKSLGYDDFGFGDYAFFGFQSGIGFVLAAIIIMAAYKNLNSSKVPASFRGFPAMLVYIGIISMAVYALK